MILGGYAVIIIGNFIEAYGISGPAGLKITTRSFPCAIVLIP